MIWLVFLLDGVGGDGDEAWFGVGGVDFFFLVFRF